MSAPDNIKVAIAIDFMDAFANIPKSKQKKVRRFLEKFREHPTSSGINYEPIKNAHDPDLYSIRVDQEYRGIVKKPSKGRVYLLLWVDKHDDAYDWAMRKRVDIHPETGSVQILTVDEDTVEPKKEENLQEEKTPLFDDVRDREMKRLGIPEMYLPQIREIYTPEDLEAMQDTLPAEAFEALFFLQEGFSLEEVWRELMREEQEKEEVDTEDYEQALEQPDSQRRFVVTEDSVEFAEVLNAPLEQWRIFLHPSQRKIVKKDVNGPIRVLGGAGTGKTVVAMHRANWLLENLYTESNDRILFTTFTVNLAADIKENLRKICKKEVLDRIKVVNLDKWVVDFLRSNSYDYDIEYNGAQSDEWSQALDYYEGSNFDDLFIRTELEDVVLENNVQSFKQYLRTPRVGRGSRISRGQKDELWPVFEEYRRLLELNQKKERIDAFRDAKSLLEEKGDILPFRCVIVDEAQDFGNAEFKLIRQMIPQSRPEDQLKNDIFIVGDAHQRIYGNKVVLSHCDIEIRGRSHRLKINYRTTEENRNWAVGILSGETYDDLDDGEDSQKGYRSLLHGTEPAAEHFDHHDEEIGFIISSLEDLKEDVHGLKSTCLVARTENMLEMYENALEERGFTTYRIKRNEAEDRSKDGIRLATMHRVKGLEFDYMFIAGVNDGTVPLKYNLEKKDSEFAKHEAEKVERSLLYVAATRAKKQVYVTSYGDKSRFLG